MVLQFRPPSRRHQHPGFQSQKFPHARTASRSRFRRRTRRARHFSFQGSPPVPHPRQSHSDPPPQGNRCSSQEQFQNHHHHRAHRRNPAGTRKGNHPPHIPAPLARRFEQSPQPNFRGREAPQKRP